jgi:hypothetical protein
MHQMSAFLVSSSCIRTVSTRPSDPAPPPNRWCEPPTRNAISQIGPPATRTRVASARRSMSTYNPLCTIAADLSADALLQQRARHCNGGPVVWPIVVELFCSRLSASCGGRRACWRARESIPAAAVARTPSYRPVAIVSCRQTAAVRCLCNVRSRLARCRPPRCCSRGQKPVFAIWGRRLGAAGLASGYQRPP